MAISTLFLTGVEISARMYRGLVTDLFGEGIRNIAAGEFKVVPRAAGANMTVTIQKGSGPDAVAYVTGDDVAGQGTYRVTMDADFPDLGIAAAPASGTRTDLVVLETVDSQVVGGSTNLSRPRVLTGVSALTSEKTVIPLARITVPAGATSIQSSNITDLRPQQTGGGATVRTAAQPLTTAQIAALTGARAGDLVFNTDLGRAQIYNGSTWGPIGGMAAGTVVIGSVAYTTAFQSYAHFIGLGFQEVVVTFTPGSGNPGGAQYTVTADATTAMGIALNSSNSPSIFAASSATDTSTFAFQITTGTGSLTVRNLRLTADGYLRYEAGGNNMTSTANFRFNWKAR